MARLKTMHKRKKRNYNRRAYKQALAKATTYAFAVRAGAYLFDRYVRPALDAALSERQEKMQNGNTETIPSGQ